MVPAIPTQVSRMPHRLMAAVRKQALRMMTATIVAARWLTGAAAPAPVPVTTRRRAAARRPNTFLVSLLVILPLFLLGCQPITPPAETPDAAATETPPAEEAPAAARGDAPGARTVQDVESIVSYREEVILSANTLRGSQIVTVTTELVKEPPAVSTTALFVEGNRTTSMETINVDGVGYVRSSDQAWTVADIHLNMAELTLVTPDAILDLVPEMTPVGTETISGRETLRLVLAQESLPIFRAGSDTMDLSGVEEAQLDLWLDTQERFVVQLVLSALDNAGTDNQVNFQVRYTYSDFNEPFEIVAPAVATVEPTPIPPPRTELGLILGFDLLIPTGSTTTINEPERRATLDTSFTAEEAVRWQRVNLEASGYTIVNESEEAGTVTLVAEGMERRLTVTVQPDGNRSLITIVRE